MNHSKASEWSVIIDLLKKTDLSLFLRLARKMMIYLSRIGVEEAKFLLTSFGAEKSNDTLDAIYDTNKPIMKKDLKDIQEISDKAFSIASHYISDSEINNNIQKWLKEDKLNFLVKAVKNLDSSLTDILAALTRYHLFFPERTEFTPYLKKNLTVLLINRFFADHLDFINIAKNFIDIDDFYEILHHSIAPNDSRGKFGGKSAGLFLAQKIIKQSNELQELKDKIKVPKTWFITSDTFQYFLYYNNLEEIIEQKYKDIEQIREEYENVVQIIKNCYFPPEIIKGLSLALEDFGDNPIIVRSSSLLEDRLGSVFYGKYKSLFLGNQGSKSEKLNALMDAIAEVYASTYGPDPLGYRKEKGLVDFNEEMAILIQEVVGKRYGKYFLPVYAGVAFSNNEVRWSPRISREDGLVRIVPGLGTRAVDRVSDDYPILFSPSKPNIRVNTLPEDILKYSPKKVDVINLETNSFETITIEELLEESGEKISNIDFYLSVYEDGAIRDKSKFEIDFKKDNLVFTFNKLIHKTDFPKQINIVLNTLKKKLGYPADIEFASDGESLYLLQCRAQSFSKENVSSHIPKDINIDRIIFNAKKYVSNGVVPEINYIVYVDPEKYNSLETLSELKSVGKAISKINLILPKRKFILIGPGRWGSRGDIKLGVSVTYSDINNTAMLIEVAKKNGNYIPDLSFGTHFFQDLVESSIKYLPLYPEDDGIIFNEEFLLNSNNIFYQLLPEFSFIKDVIHIIDVPKETDGKILRVLLNSDKDEAIAFIDQPKNSEPTLSLSDISIEIQQENHWLWRLKMAEAMARQIKYGQYGVKGIYIIGSTKNANAGPTSDIDLIIHFDGNEQDKRELIAWCNGWSLCLSEINFLRTGFKTDGILDIKIITNNEIEKGIGIASKINAITDSARPLKLKDQ